MARLTTIAGTAGDDFLFGTAGAELFLASGGNDTLDGLAGEDWYWAGRGVRLILSISAGDPALYTGFVSKFDEQGFYLGFDVFARVAHAAGGDQPDVLMLNWQANTVDGGAGDDVIDGGEGRDRIVFDLARGPAGSPPAGVYLALGANAATDPWGGQDSVIHVEDADGTPFDDVLIGDFLANVLNGLAGADTIEGRMGDDVLDGGGGGDLLRGGLGDDWYAIRDPADLAYENADEGFDAADVFAAIWSLPEGSEIEWLRLAIAGGRLNGNALANRLELGAGGGELNGQGGNDTLFGSLGNDILRGGTGMNRMEGGAGNDIYQVLDASDQVTEFADEGQDAAFVGVDGWLVANDVEVAYLVLGARLLFGGGTGQALVANAALGSTLVAGAGDDTLWDSPFADTLDGGAGNDVVYALAGADLLRGGPGDDGYSVHDARTQIIELPGEGFDQAWVDADDWVSSGGVEAAYLTGRATRMSGSDDADALVANQLLGSWLRGMGGPDILWGSVLSDTLDGGIGDDVLRGQGGGTFGDFLAGGPGNDFAVVFASNDIFFERVDEGHDSAFVYADGWATPIHVEVAYLAGEARLLLRSAGDGFLIGHPVMASTLIGGPGQDILYGGAGDDTLTGNRGNDQFHGSAGADLLRVGPIGFGHDFVYNFSGAAGEGDLLDLRGHAAHFAELLIFATEDGSRIELPSGQIEMVGLSPWQITEADVWLGMAS